jgi:hypothetical protein
MKACLDDKKVVLFVAIITAFTLFVILVVAFHVLPLGAPDVWVWQHGALDAPSRALLGLVPMLGIAIVLPGIGRGIFREGQPTRKTEVVALASLYVAAFVSANAVLLMHPLGWAYPTTLVVNPAANSYFTTALKHPDLPALLKDYPQKMSGFVSHAQTQSAGPVVLTAAVTRAAEASPLTPAIADTLLALSPGTNADELVQFCRRWEAGITASQVRAALCVALFMIAIGSLSVVPIYFLGKWLDVPGTGFFAALAFVLLPSLSLFAPSVDQMYPFVTAAGLCFAWAGLCCLETKPAWRGLLWLGLAGSCLGASLFFNMGLIVAVALCGLFALFAGGMKRLPVSQLALGAAVFSAGVLLMPALLYLTVGYDLWSVFLTSNRLRDTLYYDSRSYISSLWANPMDFFVFCGVPVFLLWLWHAQQTVCAEPRTTKAALLAAFLVTLLLLDASGRTRGEVARMWMFLTPPVLVGAGAMLMALWRSSRPATLLLLALQAMQLAAFQYFVRVWGY